MMIVARLCDTKQTSRRSRAGEWASWKGRVDISCTNHGIAPESAKIKLAVIAVLKETVVRTFRQPLSCSIFWSPILTLLLLHLPLSHNDQSRHDYRVSTPPSSQAVQIFQIFQNCTTAIKMPSIDSSFTTKTRLIPYPVTSVNAQLRFHPSRSRADISNIFIHKCFRYRTRRLERDSVQE